MRNDILREKNLKNNNNNNKRRKKNSKKAAYDLKTS